MECSNQANVLLISADFFGSNNAGEKRTLAYCRYLKNISKLDVLTPKPKEKSSNYDLNVYFCPVQNPQSGVNILIRLVREIIFLIFSVFHLIRHRKYDVVVIMSPPYLLQILPLFLRVINKKYIIDVRDDYPQVYVDAGILGNNSILFKLCMKLSESCYLNAETVVYATTGIYRSSQEFLNLHGCTPQFVLTNGHDWKTPLKNTPNGQRSNENYKIVIHGNFGKFQSVEVLNQVIQRAYDDKLNFEFHIAGFGAKYHQVTDLRNVRKHGLLDAAGVTELLTACDFGLSIRTNDVIGRNALPVKVLECVGAGLPIVSSPISSDVTELFGDSPAVAQVELDSTAIVNEILRLTRKNQYVEAFDACLKLSPKLYREHLIKEFFQKAKIFERL